MKSKFVIEDEFSNRLFDNKFKSYEDAWEFVYSQFPVIINEDGTRDDRDDILDNIWIVKENSK